MKRSLSAFRRLLPAYFKFCLTENWFVGNGDAIFSLAGGNFKKIYLPERYVAYECAIITFPDNEEYKSIRIELCQN